MTRSLKWYERFQLELNVRWQLVPSRDLYPLRSEIGVYRAVRTGVRSDPPRDLGNFHSMPHLAFDLGFSRVFTADVVERWREAFPPMRPITVDDLLLGGDPDLAYRVYRAAGADGLAFERAPNRRRPRVERWLEYFATSGRSMPTHDGADDAYLVLVEADPPAYVLSRFPAFVVDDAVA